MGTTSHIDSLISQVEALSPHFGRARQDIDAICARARSRDYRGVLQNTRLVVETLLRAIIAKKKQTPGRQTLEQLLSKMQSDLPTNVAVHVRTIQAWGNVGAHDHGADLFEGGLEVAEQEATSALNALVVILNWYRQAHLDGDASTPAAPASPAPASPAPATKASGGLKVPILVAAGVVVAIAAYVLVSTGGREREAQIAKAPPPDQARATPDPTRPPDMPPTDALDAFYLKRDLPLPPESCRPEQPALLNPLIRAGTLLVDGEEGSKRPEDREALQILSGLTGPSASFGEKFFLEAQALLATGAAMEDVEAALDQGIAVCNTMPELYNLRGKLLFREGKTKPAIKMFKRGVATGEGYGAPRLNLAYAYLKLGDQPRAMAAFDELLAELPQYAPAYFGRGAMHLAAGRLPAAVADLKRATTLDPKQGRSYLLLGQALARSEDVASAKEAFCAAKRLGEAAANELCPTP